MKDLGTQREKGDLSLFMYSDQSDERDFRDTLDAYISCAGFDNSKKARKKQKDKWRIIVLDELDKSNLSEEDKIKKLQELYAQFDYPADMAGCCIYSGIDIDPLVAMKDVLKALKSKYKTL